MNQTMIRFIQNLLENVNVPVHFIAPPYDNLTWLDSGLRASLPNASAGAMPLDKWFAQLMDNADSDYYALYKEENLR